MNRETSSTAVSQVPFTEAVKFWLKLGFISFGGPAGQIAVMHEELVQRRRWISENRFLHALNYCMLLPGPEAQQLATYVGWLLHRTWGGIVAGGLFVLPSLVIITLLSWIYVSFGDVPLIAAFFSGIKPAVVAIVAFAAYRIGLRVISNRVLLGIAIAAFISIFALRAPFPVIVAGAGLVGYLGGRLSPSLFNHLPAFVSIYFSRCADDRSNTRQSNALRCSNGSHCSGCRRDREPRCVLRLSRLMAARFRGHLSMGISADRHCSRGSALSVQSWHYHRRCSIRCRRPFIASIPNITGTMKRLCRSSKFRGS